MDNSFGILISSPGKSVIGAKKNQIIMNTNNPFLKIDTQNKAGFTTYNVLITTDPPEPPSGGGNTYTVIYQFPHNYKYPPCVEMLCYVKNPPAGSTGNQTQTYFQDAGILLQQSQDSDAEFYIVVDSTYIYFVVEKSNDGSGPALPLSGTNLLVSVHTFVENVI